MGRISPYHGKVVWAFYNIPYPGIIRRHFPYNIDEDNTLFCLWTRYTHPGRHASHDKV